jgi:hypothetical protein
MNFLHNDVWIYRNLRSQCWSIKRGGKVVMYSSSLLIARPSFVVWKTVIKRIRKERRKTPCAFVRGDIIDTDIDVGLLNPDEWATVVFNPYHNDSFISDNSPIHNGQSCLMIYPYVYVKK